MTRGIFGLVLRAAFVLTGTSVVTFALLWNAPGDLSLAIALARYDAVVPADVIAQVRAEAGLEAGFWSAFQAWLTPLLVGDFGRSSVTGRPVWPELLTAISYTFPLALAGLAIGLALSVPLALIPTRAPGGFLDRLAVAVASLGTAIPAYWLGLRRWRLSWSAA